MFKINKSFYSLYNNLFEFRLPYDLGFKIFMGFMTNMSIFIRTKFLNKN